MIQALDHSTVKHSFTTRNVPLAAMVGILPPTEKPRLGELVVAEVIRLGKHTRLDDRDGAGLPIFPGDRIVGAFGSRYATHQFEGYVPHRVRETCDLLSIGGVCGRVASRHAGVRSPTKLRILGLVCDQDGRPLNQRAFALPLLGNEPHGRVIVVVGSSTESGKTTTAGTLVRALIRAGFRIGAAKVTGTAASRDTRFYVSCGARPVLDFTDAGYPSTYMLELEQLLMVQSVLLSHLWAARPDYVVIEVADGIFQRETRMLLECYQSGGILDHLFFAVTGSLEAESGVRRLQELGLPLRATSGLIARSPLAVREAEEATGVPCLSTARLLEGDALRLLGHPVAPEPAVAVGMTAPLANGLAPVAEVLSPHSTGPAN